VQTEYMPPTTTEIRALLRRWDLSGSVAGHLLCINARTIRRYTGGERTVTYPMLFTLAAIREGILISRGAWRDDLNISAEAQK
jgi:hypothetical protein